MWERLLLQSSKRSERTFFISHSRRADTINYKRENTFLNEKIQIFKTRTDHIFKRVCTII